MVRISGKDIMRMSKGTLIISAAIMTAIGMAIMYYMGVAAASNPEWAWLFNLIYWIVAIYLLGQLLVILLMSWLFPKILK